MVLHVGGMNQFQPVQFSHSAEGKHRTWLEKTTCLRFTPQNGQYVRDSFTRENSDLGHFVT